MHEHGLTRLEALAERVDRQAGAAVAIVHSVLGRLAGWLGPVPIAIMVGRELEAVLAVHPILALLSAASMELIGVELANRWLTLQDYNETKRASDPEANADLAKWLMVGFYVMDFVGTALIVGSKLADGGSITNLLLAAYPIASVFSVISLNQGVQHQRRLMEIARDKAERSARSKRAHAKPAPKPAPATPKPASPAPVAISKAQFRAEVARLNGDLAPLATKVRAAIDDPDANVAQVINTFLESRGYVAKPGATARRWASVILDLATEKKEG